MTQTLKLKSVSTELHSNVFTAVLKMQKGSKCSHNPEGEGCCAPAASVLEQHAPFLPDEQVATNKDVLPAGALRWVTGGSSVTRGNVLFRGT